MSANKSVIAAPGVSLSCRAAKSKAILTLKVQLKFHIAKKKNKNPTMKTRKKGDQNAKKFSEVSNETLKELKCVG